MPSLTPHNNRWTSTAGTETSDSWHALARYIADSFIGFDAHGDFVGIPYFDW